jgi:hypothetical protein
MMSLLRLWPLAAALALASAQAGAQEAPQHQSVTLDAVFAEGDAATKDEEPGVSLVQPQKLRFVAKYIEAPKPCNTQALQAILDAMGKTAFFQRVAITNCIKLGADGGKEVVAWVQDVLVPGLNADAKPGGAIEIYADLLAYGVGADRARNMPFMLVSRFEPK